jgi:hypothetical protein
MTTTASPRERQRELRDAPQIDTCTLTDGGGAGCPLLRHLSARPNSQFALERVSANDVCSAVYEWGDCVTIPDKEAPSARYRRLAQECLEVAHTVKHEETRATLTQMAQIWLRLAEGGPMADRKVEDRSH